jgi:hypothetical protein
VVIIGVDVEIVGVGPPLTIDHEFDGGDLDVVALHEAMILMHNRIGEIAVYGETGRRMSCGVR